MLRVIPAINCESFEEIKKQLSLVEPFVEWVQLDVADGTFTKNTIWHNSNDLLSLETALKIEVHLMIDKVEERIKNWLIAPVSRVVFHLEAAKDPYFVIQKCLESKKEVGLAIVPETSWTRLIPFCGKVNLFQVLAVHPGLAGQEFGEENLEKIKNLRQNCSSVIIEVDGGVNKNVIEKIAEAGADLAVSASYIFNSNNIKKAIEELNKF